MQLNAFADERMKILYTLSFMQGGMAQVWAANEISAILDNMSSFSTLVELLALIEKTFGDPDQERTAHTQLHTLKMILGMMAEEYTASFEMLATWTSFNEAALEDMYIHRLPQVIVLKVYSQTSLPLGPDSWKAVVRNLDQLQRGFAELKQLIQGNGRAYGLEVLIKKEVGWFKGWISYTLSKSQRQYAEINDDHWFLARYDRRHNAAVVTSYRITPRWSASVVWEFMSGSRFTPVIGQYVVPSPTLAGLDLVPVYAPMNSVKLADTHRLDLGIKLRSRPEKKFQSEWFAGVYNVYNRASPIGITIVANADGSYSYQQPGLFGFLPFVSYGFKF